MMLDANRTEIVNKNNERGRWEGSNAQIIDHKEMRETKLHGRMGKIT